MVSSPSTSPPTSPVPLPRDMAPPDRPPIVGGAVERLADALPVMDRALPGRMPRGADGKILPSALPPSSAPSTSPHVVIPRRSADTQGDWVLAGLKTEDHFDTLVAALELHDRETKERHLRDLHHIIGSATAGRGPQEISFTRASGLKIANAYRRSGPLRLEKPDKLLVTIHPAEAESLGGLTVEAAGGSQAAEEVGLGLGLQLGQDAGDAVGVAKKKKKNKKKKKSKKGRGVAPETIEEEEGEGELDNEELGAEDAAGFETDMLTMLKTAEEGQVGIAHSKSTENAAMEAEDAVDVDGQADGEPMLAQKAASQQKEDAQEAKGPRSRPETPSIIIPPHPFPNSPASTLNFLVSPLSPDTASPNITIRMPSSSTRYPKVSLEGMTFGSISATESPAHSPPSKAQRNGEPLSTADSTRPSTPTTAQSLERGNAIFSSVPRIEIHTPEKELASPDPTEVDPGSPSPQVKILDVSIVSRPNTPATFEVNAFVLTNGGKAEVSSEAGPGPTALSRPGAATDSDDTDAPLTPTAETPLAPSITPVILDSQPSPMIARHDSRSPLGSPRFEPRDGFPFPQVAISAEILATPHPLSRSWILHTDVSFKGVGAESATGPSSGRQRIPIKVVSAESYSSSYTQLFKTSEVGDLCGKWKALRRAIAGLTMRAIEAEGEMVRDRSELGLGIHSMKHEGSFQFFEEGVQPMWEDPACARGGKITFTGDARRVDAAFLGAVLMLVSGELPDECAVVSAGSPNIPDGIKDVRAVGAVLRRKSTFMRLELWLGGSHSVSPPDEWIKRISDYVAGQLSGVKVLSYQPFHANDSGGGSAPHGGRGNGHRAVGGGAGLGMGSGGEGSLAGSRAPTPVPGEVGRGTSAPMGPVPGLPQPPHVPGPGGLTRGYESPRLDTLGHSASFAGMPIHGRPGPIAGLAPPNNDGPQTGRSHPTSPPMGVPMARGASDAPFIPRPPAGLPPMGMGLGIGPRAQGPYGLGPPREGYEGRGSGGVRPSRMGGTPMRATRSAGV